MRSPFIHHIAVFASDFDASERMFTAVLHALGIDALFRAEGMAEYWHPDEDKLSLSLEQSPSEDAITRGLHIAFAAQDRDAVDRFHEAAVANGGRSKNAPRFWDEYRAYCAFIRDPDGNNIEAVHKETNSKEAH